MSDLIEHLVTQCVNNPRIARLFRDLIKESMSKHPEGSEAHSHLLQTLNSLDTYIASAGDGYAKEPLRRSL